jgi:hypothetical protein
VPTEKSGNKFSSAIEVAGSIAKILFAKNDTPKNYWFFSLDQIQPILLYDKFHTGFVADSNITSASSLIIIGITKQTSYPSARFTEN